MVDGGVVIHIKEIFTDEIKKVSQHLKVGERILLSGTVFTSRDAAHKRIFEAIEAKSPLPYEIDGAIIYYAGPTQAINTMPIGSCGPTTSGRMDIFTPKLLDRGLGAMIGKGERNAEVISAIVRNKAVYFCATGGAGANASACIKKSEVIAFDDLGCESVKKLTIKRFPLVVAIDCFGNDIFKIGRKQYKSSV